jgi:hypothetical protein
MSRLTATREEYKDFIFDGKIPEGYEVHTSYWCIGRTYYMYIKENEHSVEDLLKLIDTEQRVIFIAMLPCGTLVYSARGSMYVEYVPKDSKCLGNSVIHTVIRKKKSNGKG